MRSGLIVIVCCGFFFECVLWQITTFPYWYWAALTELFGEPHAAEDACGCERHHDDGAAEQGARAPRVEAMVAHVPPIGPVGRHLSSSRCRPPLKLAPCS